MPKLPHLDDVVASHARLVATADRLTDDQVRQPSALPGWDRDVLLSHLRYAAEATLRGVEGAAAGELAPMYPGGESQREQEIASGAGRSAAQLAADLAHACARLEAAFRSLRPGQWDNPVLTRRGELPVKGLVLQRWLDVEAHHVDLGLDYTTDDWPSTLVDVNLPAMVGLLPALRARPDADRQVVGSWRIQRLDGPGAWTLHADGDRGWLDEGEQADVTLAGSGNDLLAVLLGRRDVSVVSIDGAVDRAGQLKSAFPGP